MLARAEIAKLKEEQASLSKSVLLTADWILEGMSDRERDCGARGNLLHDSVSTEKLTPRVSVLPIDFVAGCDVTFLDAYKTPTIGIACIKVLCFPDMTEVEEAIAEEKITFPYIPGLLAYRELPALICAYKRLASVYRARAKPRTVYIVDGQGIAHFRRLGIASHFGVMTGEITIGCAKSRLCGSFEIPIEPRAFSLCQETTTGQTATESPLTDEKTGERLGTVLRVEPPQRRQSERETERSATREFANAREKYKNLLFVSPGHRIDFETATMVVRSCLTRHIQPEPTRLAHNRLQELRRKLL